MSAKGTVVKFMFTKVRVLGDWFYIICKYEVHSDSDWFYTTCNQMERVIPLSFKKDMVVMTRRYFQCVKLKKIAFSAHVVKKWGWCNIVLC